MRKNQIFRLSAVLVLAITLVCNHAFSRLQPVRAHQLPVETFPRKFGNWTAGKDIATTPEVQGILKTARIADRIYTNPSSQWVELTLVSADSTEDLHNPKICFPNQGWMLGNEQKTRVVDEIGTSMTATQGDTQYDVLYWLTARSSKQQASAPQQVELLRARLVGVESHALIAGVEGDSLMVRLITPHSDVSQKVLKDFSQQIQDPLQPLRSEALINR